MALSSMTGFARSQGVAGAYAWAWEIKSVNAKGLDLRLRLPPGWDAVEVPARARVADRLSRGTRLCQSHRRAQRRGTDREDQRAGAAAILATLKSLGGKIDAAPPSLDGVLALKGVMEVTDADESEAERRAAETAIVAGFEAALAELIVMRRAEGATLGEIAVGAARRDRRAHRARRGCARPQAGGDQGAACRAGGDAARRLRALRQRPAASGGDPDRHQGRYPRGARPAALRTSRRRRRCIAAGGAVGRRLDFLAQELNRESNTLCRQGQRPPTSPASGSSSRAWSSNSASRCRTSNDRPARNQPPRHHAGAVVALGRRQDDADAQSARSGTSTIPASSNCRSR